MNLIDDKTGAPSSMRVAFLAAVVIGAVVVLWGLWGWWVVRPDAVQVMGIGAGLITFGLGAKAWQKQAEVRSAPPVG